MEDWSAQKCANVTTARKSEDWLKLHNNDLEENEKYEQWLVPL